MISQYFVIFKNLNQKSNLLVSDIIMLDIFFCSTCIVCKYNL
ncbi:hypothetical protein OC725_01975 ['Bituminaria bituminosa' little leaf phytoplasma]|uniref:Uncharacterized protein n=1 Tax=Candidatus Phytoplasma fabacearum TaxID=2982628 RepID=A0ABU8ZSR7_9MOLU